MQELNEIIDDLIDYWKKKDKELTNASGPNTIQSSKLANRWKDIEWFKEQASKAETNPMHKLQVIKNFTDDANKIKTEIDNI